MKTIFGLLLAISAIVTAGGKPTLSPLSGKTREDIQAGYGNRLHPVLHVERMHTGVDIDVPEGTPVVATAPGRVLTAEKTEGYGLLVVIQHPDGYMTKYAHLSKLDVRKGQNVVSGATVGRSGNTGESTREHLHYEVWKNGKPVDPAAYFPQ